MCVSDAALTFFENSNEIAAVVEEAKETAKITHSHLWCAVCLVHSNSVCHSVILPTH